MRYDYDYLIIGAGMAADAAAGGIRERDESGSIGVLGDEPVGPFTRPALTKDLWNDGSATEEDQALDTADRTGATLHLGLRVTGIDRDAKVVTVQGGDEFGYARLLVATGGHPRHLEGLEPGDRVLYYRTVADYRRLREIASDTAHVAVVGGGYIGTEIAAALVGKGTRVTLVHPEQPLLSMMFPDAIAEHVQAAYAEKGVDLRGGVQVDSVATSDDRVVLTLADGTTIGADAVVVGLGIVPSGEIAGDAGLDLADDGGIVVDEHLRSSDPAVLAAGDVAEYPDAILGRRRVEHEDNAVSMGAAAGRIMAGSDEVYDHTPMFYSDLFDDGYEAVGRLDASLETVIDEKGDGAKVVYYLDGDEVVGVLLWNVWDSVAKATEVLAAHARPAKFEGLI